MDSLSQISYPSSVKPPFDSQVTAVVSHVALPIISGSKREYIKSRIKDCLVRAWNYCCPFKGGEISLSPFDQQVLKVHRSVNEWFSNQWRENRIETRAEEDEASFNKWSTLDKQEQKLILSRYPPSERKKFLLSILRQKMLFFLKGGEDSVVKQAYRFCFQHDSLLKEFRQWDETAEQKDFDQFFYDEMANHLLPEKDARLDEQNEQADPKESRRREFVSRCLQLSSMGEKEETFFLSLESENMVSWQERLKEQTEAGTVIDREEIGKFPGTGEQFSQQEVSDFIQKKDNFEKKEEPEIESSLKESEFWKDQQRIKTLEEKRLSLEKQIGQIQKEEMEAVDQANREIEQTKQSFAGTRYSVPDHFWEKVKKLIFSRREMLAFKKSIRAYHLQKRKKLFQGFRSIQKQNDPSSADKKYHLPSSFMEALKWISLFGQRDKKNFFKEILGLIKKGKPEEVIEESQIEQMLRHEEVLTLLKQLKGEKLFSFNEIEAIFKAIKTYYIERKKRMIEHFPSLKLPESRGKLYQLSPSFGEELKVISFEEVDNFFQNLIKVEESFQNLINVDPSFRRWAHLECYPKNIKRDIEKMDYWKDRAAIEKYKQKGDLVKKEIEEKKQSLIGEIEKIEKEKNDLEAKKHSLPLSFWDALREKKILEDDGLNQRIMGELRRIEGERKSIEDHVKRVKEMVFEGCEKWATFDTSKGKLVYMGK